MIYLTNDALDLAVYFDLHGGEPRRRGKKNIEQIYEGLLGNGVYEVAVILRSSRGGVEVVFGNSQLFSFVDKDALRKLLLEMIAGETMH